MEWLQRMSEAIAYMEEHIEEPYDPATIAKVACASTFHFQRMFDMLAGVTVADYLRKRRLTLAAQELAMTKAKVLDVALKYGYDSPESFAKAFRRVHGVSPSAAREPGVVLKAYPRISFHLMLKGDKDMDYKIIEREAFKVVGKCRKISTKDGANLQHVPAFWQEAKVVKLEERLMPYNSGKAILGICLEMEMDKEHFTYMIAVESTKTPAGGDFAVRTIPASTWAVFSSVGPMPDAIQEVTQRIYQEWFPATGYEHAGTAELEVYPPGDPGAADYRCEVWIPIKKK